jgi:hypothetical protein
MNHESQAIEVEVLEIDGVSSPAKFEPSESSSPGSSSREQPRWQQWSGRVRQLDRRWWPLWVILGVILVCLILTVGLVVGILVAIFQIVGRILRTIFG